jgi:hypothetical protein
MSQNNPDPLWQSKIHERILDGDPIAFSDLCERAIPSLTDFLMKTGMSSDESLCQTVVHDLLIEYLENPPKYDPTKLDLFSYLRMAAKADLKNAIDKETRQNKKIIEFEDPNVEEWLGGRNNIQEETELSEWVEAETGLDIHQIIGEFKDQFDARELEVINLMIIEGVRETETYAQVLGISNISIEDQRKEVKKFKDKVNKKILRFGERKRRDR